MGTGRTSSSARRQRRMLELTQSQQTGPSANNNQSDTSIPTTTNDTTSNTNAPHYINSVDSFRQMSINDATNFYNDLQTKITTADIRKQNLNTNNGYQKTILAMGLHDKPTVLSDSDFDKVLSAGKDNATPMLYRGTDGAFAVDNLKYGDLTYASNGIHGHGAAYFTTSISYAQQYGYGHERSTGKDKGLVGFLDKSKTKMITETRLRAMLRKESLQTQRAFRGDSGLPAYALQKGYNCISVPKGNGRPGNGDFYVPLVRNIIVIREHMK